MSKNPNDPLAKLGEVAAKAAAEHIVSTGYVFKDEDYSNLVAILRQRIVPAFKAAAQEVEDAVEAGVGGLAIAHIELSMAAAGVAAAKEFLANKGAKL